MAAVSAILPTATPASPAKSLGREISQLCSYLYAAEAKLLALIHRFDDDGCYAQLGFHSTAHWLNYQCGIGMNAARERVRVANALPELQKIRAAFAAATLSYSKVRAITRIAEADNEDYLLMIGTYGTAHHVEKLVSRYRRAVRMQDAERAGAVHESRSLNLHFDDDGALILNGRFPAEQGALILKAIKRATDRAFHEAAANDAAQPDVAEETAVAPGGNTIGTRRADALANVAETFLNHPEPAGNTADRYQVIVHVTSDALSGNSHPPAETLRKRRGEADRTKGVPLDQVIPRSNDENPPAETSDKRRDEADLSRGNARCQAIPPSNDEIPPAETSSTPRHEEEAPTDSAFCQAAASGNTPHPPAVTPHIENGPHVTTDTARRIACDCSVLPVKEAVFGEPLAIGRKSRSIPPAIRRALQIRDGGCRFPGCTHTQFVDGHHIRHWADGGETSLDNLVLLCRQHHRLVHEGGFGCERTASGEIVFTDCRNLSISYGPPLPGIAGDLDSWLDTQFFEHSIDHDSCRAKHDADERMDWDLAVAALS